MSKTLFLSPPSFDGFDGGAGARYQAKRAFNGVTIGKGHLAEAKAAINSPRAAMNGAQSVFQRRQEPQHDQNVGEAVGGGCGTGDTSQRDELLAKIAEKKDR